MVANYRLLKTIETKRPQYKNGLCRTDFTRPGCGQLGLQT